MAKNDALLLDEIIDDRIEHNVPSNRRDEAFEYLAFEQILKNFDLSGECVIDLAEYRKSLKGGQQVEYFQLKHSTVQVHVQNLKRQAN